MRFKPSPLQDYWSDCLPEYRLQESYEQKLFKLFVPKALGGLELDLLQGLPYLMDTARAQGGWGWAVNLGAGAGYFCPFFEPSAAEALYAHPQAVGAGSGQLGGTARPEPGGGYRLSGYWDKCSGAAHATFFTVNARLPDQSVRSFALLRRQVTVVPDWNLFALQPSSSHAVRIDDVFVPEAMVFDIGKLRSFALCPILRFDFFDFARACMAASLLGMAWRLFDDLQRDMIARAPRLQGRLEDFGEQILADQTELLEGSPEEWASRVPHIARSLFDAACDLFYIGGLNMADQTAPAHYAWRDLLLACQHFLLK